MKLWKRNAVVAAIVLFVCAAVYLNWSYSKESEADAEAAASGKLLGEATLVSGSSDDPLLDGDASADTENDGTQTGQVSGGGEDYFANARINRQQARDSALSILQETIASEHSDQGAKDEANAAIQTMAAATVSEAQIENLVTAKGYRDCVAFLGESSVSVVVSRVEGGMTEADTARIMEIVMEETGLTADQITIIETEN